MASLIMKHVSTVIGQQITGPLQKYDISIGAQSLMLQPSGIFAAVTKD